MFWLRKKQKAKKQDENTWRLENEIYRKINELENFFAKLDATKARAKKEKNQNLQQVIANEYLLIENKIKMQTLSLKEMQKTYLQNQDFLNKEQLVDTYKMIDDFTISSLSDLKKITFKIRDVQEKRQKDDKVRENLTDVYDEGMDVYSSNLENDRAKSLVEQWASEKEDEELTSPNKVDENLLDKKLEENKEDL